MKKTDVARKYRLENMSMSNLKLARIMYNENPLLFTNVEHARSVIRQIEGKGNKSVKVIPELQNIPDRPRNPYKLPESDEKEYLPFIMKEKKTAVFSDIHAPYHSVSALTCAIDYAIQQNCDSVLVNGDLFDFHGISKFMRDPKKKPFAEEIEIGCQILKALQSIGKVYFKLGNHDERYEHFLWMKAKEIIGLEEFELHNIVAKRVSDVKVIGGKQIIKMGGLNVVHGHEFGSSVFSPVNTARGFYLRAKAHTLGGHHHQTSEHSENNIEGKVVVTYSTGCLCELHPEYLPINKWGHGFAIVEYDKKEFHVSNRKIVKGRVW